MTSPTQDDRRYLYSPFNPTLIENFLKGREIAAVELLTAGKCNTNYKLTLSDRTCCVLRLYRRSSPGQERIAMHWARDRVPVPEMLAWGEDWALFAWLEGELLVDVPNCIGVAAAAIAKLATIAFPQPGQLMPDGTIVPFPFGGVQGFIRQSLVNPVVKRWLTADAIAALQELLHREASCLDTLDRQASLVHGDFNPTNILIRNGELSGLLDWEFCHAGTPYMDIGNLLRHYPQRANQIAQGLQSGGMILPADWQKHALLVDLTSQIEFLTSSRSARFKPQCVQQLHRAIALILA